MRNLKESFKDAIPAAWAGGASSPAADVTGTGAAFKIRAEMPGLEPDNADDPMTDGFLTIMGKKEERKEAKGEILLR